MRTRSRKLRFIPLSFALAILAVGCEEPRNPEKSKKVSEPAPSREILGKRTQDIRPGAAELPKGAQIANPRITAKDPITLQGNAYVTSIGRIAVGQIEHSMNLFKAANDRYPKDYNEFMNDIIKANNIALPRLPEYQEYRYNPNEHKLEVWEYPDRK